MKVIQFPERQRTSNSCEDNEQLNHIAEMSGDIVGITGSVLDGSYLVEGITDNEMERIRLTLLTISELASSLRDYTLTLVR